MVKFIHVLAQRIQAKYYLKYMVRPTDVIFLVGPVIVIVCKRVIRAVASDVEELTNLRLIRV